MAGGGSGFLPMKEWGFSQDPWPRPWGGGWHEEAGGWSRRASTVPLGWWCPGLTVGLRHLAPFSCASTCPHTAGSRLDREQLPNLAPVYGRGHQREPPRVAPVQGTMAVSRTMVECVGSFSPLTQLLGLCAWDSNELIWAWLSFPGC